MFWCLFSTPISTTCITKHVQFSCLELLAELPLQECGLGEAQGNLSSLGALWSNIGHEIAGPREATPVVLHKGQPWLSGCNSKLLHGVYQQQAGIQHGFSHPLPIISTLCCNKDTPCFAPEHEQEREGCDRRVRKEFSNRSDILSEC